MTSAPVTSMGQGSYGLPSTNATQSQSNGENFGSVMNQAKSVQSSNRTQTAAAGVTQKKVSDNKTETGADVQKESATDNSETSRIDTSKQDTAQTETKAADTDTTDTVQDTTDTEAVDATEDAAKEMLGKIADELDVSEEDILKAMETLGLSLADLLNQDSLGSLITELTGEGDLLALTTNEGLYAALQNLTDAMNDLVDGIKEQFSLTDEEMKQIMNQLEQTDNQTQSQTGTADFAQTLTGQEGTLLPEEQMQQKTAENEAGQKTDTQEEQQIPQDAADTDQVTDDSKSGQNAANGDSTGAQNQNTDNGQNLFQMNLDQTVTHVNGENIVTPYGSVSPSSIMQQITEYMSLQTREDLTEMEMQLNPANLGSIHLSLTAREGAITATLTAQNEAVKNVLESQIMIVRENLESQGVKVEAVEVTVASHAFEQNLNNGNDTDAEEEAGTASKKRSIRRLDLNDPEIEGMEMDEEEILTREVMKMNGNSVDYTA